MTNRYAYKEFPRVVYGPEGENTTISQESERPDGWTNTPGEQIDTAKEDAKAAEKAAAEAEKALRDELKDFLDRHSVDYAKNLGTPKLQELADQLTAHLEAQALEQPKDDAGE